MVNAAPYGGGHAGQGPEPVPALHVPRRAGRASSSGRAAWRRSASGCGVPLAAAALQFSLRDPRITSTIVGMTKPERVAQTLELARMELPEEIWAELDRAAGF